MAKISLFNRIKQGITGLIKGLRGELSISTPKSQESEEMEHIRQQEIKWQSEYNKKLDTLKEKYTPLFELAHTKYSALEKSGIKDYSSAYQNAGSDFTSSVEITDMGSLFREVARAQTFVKDPMSNIEIIKQMLEDDEINIYVGRGNGSDDMKAFWSAVNRAKETAGIREKIVQKQYSGAFEYAYNVWSNTNDADDITVLQALNDFLKIETSVREQDFMTPTALKYEPPSEDTDNDFYLK